MFYSPLRHDPVTCLGAIWLDGANGMRFRFEVRAPHITMPGAIEIQARLKGGRYIPLAIRESGRGIPDPRATHVLTHRPAEGDPLCVTDVMKALRNRR